MDTAPTLPWRDCVEKYNAALQLMNSLRMIICALHACMALTHQPMLADIAFPNIKRSRMFLIFASHKNLPQEHLNEWDHTMKTQPVPETFDEFTQKAPVMSNVMFLDAELTKQLFTPTLEFACSTATEGHIQIE